MDPRPTRVVIADDHPLIRAAVGSLIESAPGLELVGEATHGIQAVEVARRLKPDLLLLDLSMPGMRGLEPIERLKASEPETRILLLTGAIDESETAKVLRLGARGVVLKEEATQDLLKAIQCVMAGEYWIGRHRMSRLLETLQRGPDSADRGPDRLG